MPQPPSVQLGATESFGRCAFPRVLGKQLPVRGIPAIARLATRALDSLLATALALFGLGTMALAAWLGRRLAVSPVISDVRALLHGVLGLMVGAGGLAVLAALLLARLALVERRIRRCV